MITFEKKFTQTIYAGYKFDLIRGKLKKLQQIVCGEIQITF
jgi:hypothetical protein